MPIRLSDLTVELFLRILFIAPPKVGKTTVAITTSPRPVRVILCEDDSALDEARRQGADDYTDLERAIGRGKNGSDAPYEQMTTFLAQAKEDAKAGTIKTVITDGLSYFAERLLEQSFKLNQTQNSNDDGRSAYPHYAKRLHHCIELMLTIPAHVIVISHYEDLGSSTLGAAKTGGGIVPNIPGKPRLSLGGRFRDVIWLDIDKDDPQKRDFYTHPKGTWGPGCRSMPSNYDILPADFEALIKTFAKHRPGKQTNGVAKPSLKPISTMKIPPKPQLRK